MVSNRQALRHFSFHKWTCFVAISQFGLRLQAAFGSSRGPPASNHNQWSTLLREYLNDICFVFILVIVKLPNLVMFLAFKFNHCNSIVLIPNLLMG